MYIFICCNYRDFYWWILPCVNKVISSVQFSSTLILANLHWEILFLVAVQGLLILGPHTNTPDVHSRDHVTHNRKWPRPVHGVYLNHNSPRVTLPQLEYPASVVVLLNMKFYGRIRTLVIYLEYFCPQMYFSEQLAPPKVEKFNWLL